MTMLLFLQDLESTWNIMKQLCTKPTPVIFIHMTTCIIFTDSTANPQKMHHLIRYLQIHNCCQLNQLQNKQELHLGKTNVCFYWIYTNSTPLKRWKKFPTRSRTSHLLLGPRTGFATRPGNGSSRWSSGADSSHRRPVWRWNPLGRRLGGCEETSVNMVVGKPIQFPIGKMYFLVKMGIFHHYLSLETKCATNQPKS